MINLKWLNQVLKLLRRHSFTHFRSKTVSDVHSCDWVAGISEMQQNRCSKNNIILLISEAFRAFKRMTAEWQHVKKSHEIDCNGIILIKSYYSNVGQTFHRLSLLGFSINLVSFCPSITWTLMILNCFCL